MKTFDRVYTEIEEKVKTLDINYSVENNGVGTFEYWGNKGVDYGTTWIEPEETEISVEGVNDKLAEEIVEYSEDNLLYSEICGIEFIGKVDSFCLVDGNTAEFYISWEEK